MQGSSPTPNRERIHVHARQFPSMNARAVLYLSFALLWLACSIFFLARLLAHHLYIVLILRSAVAAKDSFGEACAGAACELGISPPPVLQSPSVRSPFLAGIVHPCILLPLGGRETPIESRAVFLHELAHLRRRDTLWNLLRHIGVALIPFQPLMWMLSRRIEETSDDACDDVVTSVTGNHTAYARNLIAIAGICSPSGHELAAGVGIVSASPLCRRIERILDASRAVTLRISARMLMLVYSLCIAVTFLAGLVGIRGKTFAQIQKIPETVSRGATAVALAAAAAVKDQVVESLRPRQPEHSADQKSSYLPDTIFKT